MAIPIVLNPVRYPKLLSVSTSCTAHNGMELEHESPRCGCKGEEEEEEEKEEEEEEVRKGERRR